MEVMEEGEVDKERWKMQVEEEPEEFWGFEDLESECGSSFSSPHDSREQKLITSLEDLEVDENVFVTFVDM